MPRGRVGQLDKQPGLIEAVAELYCRGLSYAQILHELDLEISPRTLAQWVKDPRVQAKCMEITQQRVSRITRKIDSRIEGMLDNEEVLKTMDLKDLLAIRKELTPRKLEVGGAGEFETVAEAAVWGALDSGMDVGELVEGTAEDDDE